MSPFAPPVLFVCRARLEPCPAWVDMPYGQSWPWTVGLPWFYRMCSRLLYVCKDGPPFLVLQLTKAQRALDSLLPRPHSLAPRQDHFRGACAVKAPMKGHLKTRGRNWRPGWKSRS